MSRRSTFKTADILEMKKEIRTGAKITTIAKRLAPKMNVSENTMRNKLYSVAAHTYQFRGRPKVETPRNTKTVDMNTATGKKVVMYDDHIRIYF